LSQNEAGAHKVRRRGRRDRGARDHHNGSDLRLSDELTVGQRGRRDSASDDLHLIVHDHLLDEPPRIVGDTAIVPKDDFHSFARDGIAVVLHVEARPG